MVAQEDRKEQINERKEQINERKEQIKERKEQIKEKRKEVVAKYVDNSFESKAKAIADKIENITKEEKATLKSEVEAVNVQLENGSITKEQADTKKKDLAQARATIIENRVAVAQEELKELVQQKVNGKIASSENPLNQKDSLIYNGKKYSISVKVKDSTYIDADGIKRVYKKKYKEYSERRTTSQFVFALGLNNVVTDGSVENSDFKFAGSRFYEWGVSYNTRIDKSHNLLHLKYGASLVYNDLRPTENRVFAVNGNQTTLQTSTIDLKSARFRNVYLVAPLHLEFDFTKKKEKEGKTYFNTHNSFRLGVGGYAGIRIKSKQKIEYEIDDVDYDEKAKGDFNASNFIYGLSAYVGYKETSLYIKYDLNPIFQDNVVKQNNVSLGIRFDFN
ncbi:hypothetical protein GCM10022388_14650 [Flavobacterium chungnamense]|uniref:Outer membrane protein beta-barrel domain-containing protein n=2 Tax=Flavobacterium chungnamense TaxID=706182 RepID=A0ABP7UQC0_9FLAO